ncbi:MAG: XRE family transcriptional regulator [Treponemataceae bacterium]|uniref:helix-turn-helix domain-containing protein n=1 Tax=Treponema sp. J25 TaxID=2094121 RepID=UPI0010444E69|nr:XRE family transcriptional regulator [Treponema sp. J25]MCX7948537.1 XRE family transcriptional regulator [Treponemataceae bacterium]TCW62183.1 DNA-binding protein [Treponema sp. J25]
MDRESNPGKRIRKIRETNAISREDLAERSHIPVELLKKIEEEDYLPDLAPLVKIARALGVRLGTLLDDYEELGPVVCKKGSSEEVFRFTARNAQSPEGLVFNALAAHKAGRAMEPFLVEVRKDANPALSSHEGEEFLYVLEGAIKVEYGTTAYNLEQGDSIYYESIVPHRVIAQGGTARILAVLYTPH